VARLKKIWIEHDFGQKRAIRIDWKNDRHQRVEIEDDSPEAVSRALRTAAELLKTESARGKI
jgi:hypothetical protein